MLKKFAFNCLRNFNAAFGMVSLTAIGLGAIATFSGLGLLYLARGGFPIVEKERSEQIAYIGTGVIVLGFTGIIFASLGGAFLSIVEEYSDKLLELGTEVRLLSYIQYFRTRNVVVFDYVALGRVSEFAKELKGIAKIEVDGDDISIFFDIYAPCHRFRRDGVALYPYSTFVPQELKYNYNLVSYVNYLKSKKSGVLG
ncbi:MAG: hypothetical protein KME52_28950 [Desmonostoc geniculatum HA4340-LM1]|jgi:hypothetical protein|nr:hypothetical protein [Desmonostoc geniculatum HA4340-LM1]